jgi:hypothetical protein
MNEVTKTQSGQSFTKKASSATALSYQPEFGPFYIGLSGYGTRNVIGTRGASNIAYSVCSYDGTASLPESQLARELRRRATSDQTGIGRRNPQGHQGIRRRMKKFIRHRHRILPWYVGIFLLAEIICLLCSSHPF